MLDRWDRLDWLVQRRHYAQPPDGRAPRALNPQREPDVVSSRRRSQCVARTRPVGKLGNLVIGRIAEHEHRTQVQRRTGVGFELELEAHLCGRHQLGRRELSVQIEVSVLLFSE